MGKIPEAIQIKDSLSHGCFGKNIKPNSETYEALLSHTKYDKKGEKKPYSFSTENIQSIKKSMTDNPKAIEIFFKGKVGEKDFKGKDITWSFSLFLEIFNRKMAWTNRLEELFILSALDNRDHLLLSSILQKNENLTLKNLFNSSLYIDSTDPFQVSSIRLAKLRAKCWHYLGKQSPAKNEIVILEKSKVPPAPNIYDFNDVITDSFSFINYIKSTINSRNNRKDNSYTAIDVPSELDGFQKFGNIKKFKPALILKKPNDVFEPTYNNLAIKKLFQRYKYFDSLWISYEYYLRTLLHQHQWQKALLELSEMRLKPISPPSASLYKIFISNLSRKKEAIFLTDIYSMMRLDGITIDGAMFENLISGCVSGDLSDSLALTIYRLELYEKDSSFVSTGKYLNSGRINKFQLTKKILNNLKRNFPISTSVFGFNIKSTLGYILSPMESYFSYKSQNPQKIQDSPKTDSNYSKDKSADIQPNSLSIDEVGSNKTIFLGPTISQLRSNKNAQKYYESKEFSSLTDFESLKDRTDYYMDSINHELLFYNQSLFFYSNYMIYLNSLNNNASHELKLNSAFCVLLSLVHVKDPLLFPSNFFDKFHLSYEHIEPFLNYPEKIRALSIIQFYYNVIDIGSSSNVISNNHAEFFSNSKYEMLLKIPYQSFYSLGMYQESNQIVEQALMIGISI
ncbi:hypothetical protein AYI68_g2578 [Smittium mucronatum]|uniref:Uncharacterized protein n=1 Tax=Smittium mucronatum TaxID=133383 RepID=A0A1R0H2E0_9FUNG|nr:hypothetical protein AYI68_g2578 [Smittium mucronatum]